jgi:hypothetical protein
LRDAQEDGSVACGQRSGCRARRTGSARAAHAVTHPRRASAVASAMAAAPPGVAPAPASDSICSPFSKPDSGGGPAPPAAPPQAAIAEAPGCGNGGACDHRAPCAPVTPCASACACSRPDGVSSPRALGAGDGAPSRIRSRCASCTHAEAPSAMLSSTARERARLVDARVGRRPAPAFLLAPPRAVHVLALRRRGCSAGAEHALRRAASRGRVASRPRLRLPASTPGPALGRFAPLPRAMDPLSEGPAPGDTFAGDSVRATRRDRRDSCCRAAQPWRACRAARSAAHAASRCALPRGATTGSAPPRARALRVRSAAQRDAACADATRVALRLHCAQDDGAAAPSPASASVHAALSASSVHESAAAPPTPLVAEPVPAPQPRAFSPNVPVSALKSVKASPLVSEPRERLVAVMR